MLASINLSSIEHPIVCTVEMLHKDTMPGFIWVRKLKTGEVIRIDEHQIISCEKSKQKETKQQSKEVKTEIISNPS